MADTGYRNPTLGQSIVISGGDKHWSNPTYIYSSNNSRASANLYYDEQSHWLRATNFGFSIPDGATILGIMVQIEKMASRIEMRDNSVKIVKAGSESGTEKRVYTDWPYTDAYTTYGGSTDLWGLTWTRAQINASNFGVSISAAYIGEQFSANASVDHIRIKVYYTEPPANVRINIGDVWKDVSNIYIRDGTPGLDWKPVVKVQINIGDSWKTIFG